MWPVKAGEFLKRVQKCGKRNGVDVVVTTQGKGSHSTLYYGLRFTTLKDLRHEVGRGLLHTMLKDLGLTEDDIE
jgi:mRNA interferase HicA